MKSRITYFFWILFFAFGLMILVLMAQILNLKNITGLKKGNREAVITFTINNRLQDLANLSFELETKVISSANRAYNRQSITDSLTMLGYNGSVLEQINLNREIAVRFKKLNRFINQQIEISLRVLQNKSTSGATLIDSLRKLQIADSVYVTALTIQKNLENDLQTTLSNNTKKSSSLLFYNRLILSLGMLAIVLFSTIIIYRYLRQLQLISALENATAAAKKSAQIKEQFLANMSHEIRTPLNAIKGFSRLISQTPLSREQQQYAGIINDASGSLIHIVNDILDISKIEAGKLRIEKKEFNLSKILQTVEYLFFNAAKEKQLKYSQHINDDVPMHLKGDPERLSQILINLVSNGIKFTQTGYVNTHVSLSKEENGKVWIEFQVKDSGIGIPADKQEAIFQRFEQLDTKDEDIIQGTGLGLSIVKSLAELMGGNIVLASEQGKGTIFKVLLPFEKCSVIISNENKTDLIPAYYYTGASVLVVEDNKINQLLIKHTLAGVDITTEIVSNGQEALETVAKRKFDLVLLDIQMPVMDGYATIQALRKRPDFTTPVVAMTAFAMPGEKEKCLAAGMNDYLAKPIDFTQLINVLEKFLVAGKATEKIIAVPQITGDSFLLGLAGGDRNIARRILEEIKQEIPAAAKKLEEVKKNKEFTELNSICHHMVSTFAPMGNETKVIKKIQQLRNVAQDEETGNNNIMLIDGLLLELNLLEKELAGKIESMI